MNSRLTASCLLFLGVALVSPTLGVPEAYAQEDDLKRARKLFGEAQSAFKAKKYKDAATKYKASYELSNRPKILFYLAEAHAEAGDLLEAQASYQAYLDKVPDADNGDEVLDLIRALGKRIKREYGSYEIVTKTEGREIYVDGAGDSQCVTPCELKLKPGSHTIVLRGDGVPELTKELDVSAGDQEKLSLSMVKKASSRGSVLISSDAAGSLKVGSRTASLPMREPLGVSAGTQKVEITTNDNKTWRGEVRVQPDKTLEMYVPLKHLGGGGGGGGSIIQTASFSLIGIGVGLLVGGALFGVETANMNELISQRNQVGPVAPQLIDRAQAQQNTANLLFILGGVAVAGGGGLFAWDFFSSSGETAAPSEEDEAAPAPKEEEGGKDLLDDF